MHSGARCPDSPQRQQLTSLVLLQLMAVTRGGDPLKMCQTRAGIYFRRKCKLLPWCTHRHIHTQVHAYTHAPAVLCTCWLVHATGHRGGKMQHSPWPVSAHPVNEGGERYQEDCFIPKYFPIIIFVILFKLMLCLVKWENSSQMVWNSLIFLLFIIFPTLYLLWHFPLYIIKFKLKAI